MRRERERGTIVFSQMHRFLVFSSLLLHFWGRKTFVGLFYPFSSKKKQLAVAKKKKKQEARSKKKQEEERETRERERKDDGVFWFFVIFRGGGGIASAKNRPRARLKTRLLGGLDAFRGRV